MRRSLWRSRQPPESLRYALSLQVYPRLSSSRAEEYEPESWYCVSWQPVYTIPTLPDQASLGKGSFLTFHSLTSEPVKPGSFLFPEAAEAPKDEESETKEMPRGRTRSRSCSPNQQVNATPLSPVPRLKIEVGGDDTDQASGSGGSSPSSSPIGSATGSSLRRERSHSSPAIGRRDRSHSELMSPNGQARRDAGSARSGSGRRNDNDISAGAGEEVASTPRAGDSAWDVLPARQLSPSLDAVATPPVGEGDSSAVSSLASGAVKDSEAVENQVSPPKVEGGDQDEGQKEEKEEKEEKAEVALEGAQFPALGSGVGAGAPRPGSNPTEAAGQPVAKAADAAATAATGEEAPAAAAAAAAAKKPSAWGGRSFAAIVRTGGAKQKEAPKASKPEPEATATGRGAAASTATDASSPSSAAAGASETASGSVVRVPLVGSVTTGGGGRSGTPAADEATPTVAATVFSPNSSPRAADRAKGLGGRPVKLTGAWKQQSTAAAAKVQAATGVVSATVAAPAIVAVSPPAVPVSSSSSPAASAGGGGGLQAQPSSDDATAGATTADAVAGSSTSASASAPAPAPAKSSRSKSSGGDSAKGGSKASEKRTGGAEQQVAEEGQNEDGEEEGCGMDKLDMSPGLVGLGIGGRVDSTTWELTDVVAAAAAAGGETDAAAGGAAGSATPAASGSDDSHSMKRVHSLIAAVPALLQAGRVALPGASRLSSVHPCSALAVSALASAPLCPDAAL